MSKRMLLLLLAAVFCFGIFAGCSNGEPEPTDQTASQAASPEQTVEATPSAEAIQTPETTASSQPAGRQGMILVSTAPFRSAEVLENEQLEDGTYVETLLVDGMVRVSYERHLPALDGGTPEEAVAALEGETLRELEVEEAAELTEIIGYPAWKLEYVVGQNEATMSCIDCYIQTDDWDFRFHTEIPIDHYEEYADWMTTSILDLRLEETD